MAGAGKRRVKKEREGPSSSVGTSQRPHDDDQPSQSPSRPTSERSGSRSESAPQTSPKGVSTGRSPPRFDGNRDPEAQFAGPSTAMKRIDFGMGEWSAARGIKVDIVNRPKPSSLGKEIQIGLNTFNVSQLPDKAVFQYDVLIGNGAEKRGLIAKLWRSKAVAAALPNEKSWLFDGNKLAWSMEDVQKEMRITVDLDAEEGRQVRANGKPNVHRVFIKQSTKLRFDVLNQYLAGKCDFDNKCLEIITFADHLLRESPSRKFTPIKRNFFAKGQTRFPLGSGIEAFKGVYQSIRIAHQQSGQHCLTVNVDVANGTFWTEGKLMTACMLTAKANSEGDLINKLKPQNGRESRGMLELKRLRRLWVITAHNDIEYCIDKFLPVSARDHKFKVKDANGTEKSMSVYEYFQVKYKFRLVWPDLPLVRMTKKNSVLPIEMCKIKGNQRYLYKLDDKQTSQMIKFAVTPPAERWKAVEHGLGMVDWQNDPYLKNYGMKINSSPAVVKARLLQAPVVQFAGGAANPGTSGRWDLRGKKFLTPNPQPLKSWSVTVLQARGVTPDKTTIERFIDEFVKGYAAHGGRIETRKPLLACPSGNDVGKIVEEAWNKCGNHFNMRPQMLVFILPDKDSIVYGRIKKSCEARYGVVSQCMQYAHVQKCQGQYISNVCMKFNAKLGGVTARAVGAQSKGPEGLFKVPTMIIGADVSHAAPGAQTASVASMTVSTDRLCTRYAASNNTNGFRTEMITTSNISKLLTQLIMHWMQQVGSGRLPQRILYFRDGVSEGQFQHVLRQEVKDMKDLLRKMTPNLPIPPFVVIVASKRHHIRFFPRGNDKDRNGNPLPGTLVESGVTHPRENDFYLCSHAALKGTSRPTHYHVLLNEATMSNEELQTIIYEHSYQYIRSTTPVSLFPAVYYAHLASVRAIHHDASFGGGSGQRPDDNKPKDDDRKSASGSQSGQRPSSPSGSGSRAQSPSRATITSTDKTPGEFPDLMTMPDGGRINTAMWYI